MNIRIRIGHETILGSLDDNPASGDFRALLPLSLRLSDYAQTEKIADLPRRLSTEGSPPGITPQPGDIAFYAPWGNLAIFYKGAAYATGLIRLGRISSGLDLLAREGATDAVIERIEER